MLFSGETDSFSSALPEFLHVVYLGYSQNTAGEPQVLPWFFLEAEISGTHNYFLGLRRLLLPEWNGSCGTLCRFHLGCSGRIPLVSQ